MFKKARLRLIILVVFLACAIGFIGINTYRKLSSVLEQTGTLMAERNYRIELQQLRSALSTADSRVQSFRLTQDIAFVNRYHRSMSESSALLDTLYRYPQDSSQLLLLDTLQNLLVQKEHIMQAIMLLENSEEVTSELGVISRAINTVKPINTAQQTPQKSLLGSIGSFFKRKKAAPDSLAQLKSEVFKGLKTVRQNQVNRLKTQKQEEFVLLAENNHITQNLDSILQLLEQKEEARVKQNVLLAHENADTVRTFNIIFAVSLTLILAAIGLVIISFIHRNQQYTEAIERTKEEALSLARTKETFLANMSHEIRTPLTAIVGFSEQVSENPTPENISRFIPVIGRSAKFLHNIVNDILDYSKITANKMSFSSQPFPLSEIVTELTALFEPRFNNQNIRLRFIVYPAGQQTVSTDIVRFKQILINLLSNSLKYTRQGEVVVSLSFHQTSQTLECSISDTGVGIEPSRLPFVFEEFEQARAGEQLKRGSTGLGLSICKKLIELQGGSIAIESTLLKGTTIRFSLPVQSEMYTAETASLKRTSLSGKKILIADDEPFNTQLLSYILQKHRALCVVYSTAKEAFSAINHQPFDLLLVDYRMPEMNGVELIEKARNTSENSQTPFILLTAETSAETLELAKQYGQSALLAKPFSEHELLAKIATHFDEPSEPFAENTTHSVVFSSLQNIATQHPEMYRDLLVTFLNSTREGVAAMELACEKIDIPTIKNWAHKLAPASRHMGASDLLHALKKLEGNDDTTLLPAAIAELKTVANQTLASVEKELERL